MLFAKSTLPALFVALVTSTSVVAAELPANFHGTFDQADCATAKGRLEVTADRFVYTNEIESGGSQPTTPITYTCDLSQFVSPSNLAQQMVAACTSETNVDDVINVSERSFWLTFTLTARGVVWEDGQSELDFKRCN